MISAGQPDCIAAKEISVVIASHVALAQSTINVWCICVCGCYSHPGFVSFSPGCIEIAANTHKLAGNRKSCALSLCDWRSHKSRVCASTRWQAATTLDNTEQNARACKTCRSLYSTQFPRAILVYPQLNFRWLYAQFILPQDLSGQKYCCCMLKILYYCRGPARLTIGRLHCGGDDDACKDPATIWLLCGVWASPMWKTLARHHLTWRLLQWVICIDFSRCERARFDWLSVTHLLCQPTTMISILGVVAQQRRCRRFDSGANCKSCNNISQQILHFSCAFLSIRIYESYKQQLAISELSRIIGLRRMWQWPRWFHLTNRNITRTGPVAMGTHEESKSKVS